MFKKKIPDIDADVTTLEQRVKKRSRMFWVLYIEGILCILAAIWIYFTYWLIAFPLFVAMAGFSCLILAAIITTNQEITKVLIYLKRRYE